MNMHLNLILGNYYKQEEIETAFSTNFGRRIKGITLRRTPSELYLFISIKLTDKEAEVAKKIGELCIEVGEESIDNIEFKEDLYVSFEMTSIIKELVEKICDVADDELEHLKEEINDYKTMTKIGDVNSDNEMEFRLDYSILEIVDGYK